MKRYFQGTKTGKLFVSDAWGRMERATSREWGEVLGEPLRGLTRPRYLELLKPEKVREAEIIDRRLDEPRRRRH